jgi:hypothetical protein
MQRTGDHAMTESPSRYAGIAAVLVLGIGLLAVGKMWGYCAGVRAKT